MGENNLINQEVATEQARWGLMKDQGTLFLQSNSLPDNIKNLPQAVMIIQAGREIGMQPIESLNSFYFVKGKLTMYGTAVISQVLRAGHEIIWGECNAETATVEIIRGDNKNSYKTTFTIKEVQERGLNMGYKGVKDVWKKFPDSMLKYGAFSRTARFICPDALRGILIKEEMEGNPSIDLEEGKTRQPPKAIEPQTHIEIPTVEAQKPVATINHMLVKAVGDIEAGTLVESAETGEIIDIEPKKDSKKITKKQQKTLLEYIVNNKVIDKNAFGLIGHYGYETFDQILKSDYEKIKVGMDQLARDSVNLVEDIDLEAECNLDDL
jgi:hypothetical protein